jgi:hypothetical protein
MHPLKRTTAAVFQQPNGPPQPKRWKKGLPAL